MCVCMCTHAHLISNFAHLSSSHADISKGILRKGTMAMVTPSKATIAPEKSQRSVSERKPSGTRSVASLFEKSSVLSSAVTAAVERANSNASHHTPSRLPDCASHFSAEPPRGSQTAPRPTGAGARGNDCNEEDDFEFSKDLTSLSEILQGSGISETRLVPEAATMRKSSVHEFRQLREKRASIFKGALRVVKTNFKASSAAAATNARNHSFYSNAAATVENSRTEIATRSRAAASMASWNVAPPAVIKAAAHDCKSGSEDTLQPARFAGNATKSATPSRALAAVTAKETMTPRSLHKGTSGFGAKAEMTPVNARAKGVAGVLGSLLKDRAAAAATPAAVSVGEEDAASGANDSSEQCHVDEAILRSPGVALQLDMSQGTPDKPNGKHDDLNKASHSDGTSTLQQYEPVVIGVAAPAVATAAPAEAPQVKRPYRSRKSELMAESRMRVGVKSPRRKRVHDALDVCTPSVQEGESASKDDVCSLNCSSLLAPLMQALHQPLASQVPTPSPSKLKVRPSKLEGL